MNENNQNDNKPDAESRCLNTIPAGLSLLFPGLGQLIQGRKVFIVHMILYVLSLAIIYRILSHGNFEHWSINMFDYFRILRGAGIWAIVFSVLPLLTILFSVLDAAVWQKNTPSPYCDHFIRLSSWIVVVFLLLVVFIPAVSCSREAARRMQCNNQLKTIAIAFHDYHDEYRSLPPPYTVDQEGRPLHSWRVLILPYIEQKELYEKIRLDEPWNSDHNRQFHDIRIETYCCPSSYRDGIGSKILPKFDRHNNCYYSVVTGKETAFPYQRSISFHEITDGNSNTILAVERLLPICWMNPEHEIRFETATKGINRDFYGIGSVHYGGANVAFADGATRFIPENIDPKELKAMLTKSGQDGQKGILSK